MKKILEYRDLILWLNLKVDCTTIFNSFKVTKKEDMIGILSTLKDLYKEDKYSSLAINNRSIDSMVREWRAHNLLYDLYILRSRTGNVDLNINQKWYIKTMYFILSLFY